MTVRVYTSMDAGAPELTSTPGALVAILNACLVDGYGSGPDEKTPLGWTKTVAASGEKAAYRSTADASPKHFLYVDDTGDILTDARAAQIWGATDFTWDGENPVLTNQYPTDAQSGHGLTVGKSSSTSQSLTRQWLLIGDERAFYFIWRNDSNDSFDLNSSDFAWRNRGMFFGDLIPTPEMELVIPMIASSSTAFIPSATSNFSPIFNGTSGSDSMRAAFNKNQTILSPSCALLTPGFYPTGRHLLLKPYAEAPDKSLLVHEVPVFADNELIGYLPGYRWLEARISNTTEDYGAFFPTSQIQGTISLDGNYFAVAVCGDSSSSSGLAIFKLTDWYA